MSGILFIFILLIVCLCYVLYKYLSESESFVTRDVPAGGYTDPPLDTGPFPGQGVTRPEQIAPSTRQGILSDYTISLDKPYDDFISPEPHHLETIWPESLDRTCKKLNRTDCTASQYCILVNGETEGEVCRGAFPNTADARMYNNYATKLLPQSDLSYYYRDGICYGECSGWNPNYATPDPIQLYNIRNKKSDVNSSAGMLTPDEMYGRITIPLNTNMPTSTPTITPTPNPFPLDMNSYVPSDENTNNGTSVTNIPSSTNGPTFTNIPNVTNGPNNALVCTPACAHNYSCENNSFNQAVCMPVKRLYGAQPRDIGIGTQGSNKTSY